MELVMRVVYMTVLLMFAAGRTHVKPEPPVPQPPSVGAESDFEVFKPWIRRALQVLIPEPALTLVNVNFPRTPRGLVWARASVRRYAGQIVPTEDPTGRKLYWFTVIPIEQAEEGTDRWAVEQGWISLTPLRLDPTDQTLLDRLSSRSRWTKPRP